MIRSTFALCALALLASCKPSSPPPPAHAANAPTIHVAHTQPAETVSAKMLVKAFVQNESLASRQWRGKELIVEGVVEELGEDMWGESYLLLYTKDLVSRVQCYVPDANATFERLRKQNVSIKGYCEGFSRHVIIRNGELVAKQELAVR